jgi:hypothetical protein
MAGEAHQNPLITTEPTADGNKSDSRTKTEALATSSSATVAVIKMASNKIPGISDYWKKSNVSEANRKAYHDFGWLTGNPISSILE